MAAAPFQSGVQVGVPKIRSSVARMWDAVEVITENAGHSVATDLLRQRYDAYMSRRHFFGDMADFRESVEAMTSLEGGTGKVLRDIG